VFPEFSLLRLNLARSCGPCNSQKLAKVVDEQGEWIFVHPYFDDFLASELWVVGADVENNAPVFSFSVSNALDVDVGARVSRHAKELDLENRLAFGSPRKEAILALELHKSHYRRKLVAVDDVRAALDEVAAEILNQRPNDPYGLALRSLAACADLQVLLDAPT
jgi:hypothetical protein